MSLVVTFTFCIVCAFPHGQTQTVFYIGNFDAASLCKQWFEKVTPEKEPFTIPCGTHSFCFVSELARLFRAYAQVSTLECIAPKATTVLSIYP